MKDWLIYGANGYTGKLIAEEAARRDLSPILAGRSASALRALGDGLDCPVRVFSLDDPHEIDRNLEGVSVVLHCAGPFSATFEPMLEACLRKRVDYLDITGELDVFETLYSRADEITFSGITAISGVGFDVVPTDCLAALLARELPDATWLRLALSGVEAVSVGTARASLEAIAKGGWIRRDGRLESVPLGFRTRQVPFGATSALAMTVPLGDLVSAARSTGIPNIEVYLKTDLPTLWGAKVAQHLGPLLTLAQGPLKQAIAHLVHGPTAHQRETARTVVWGEVVNPEGEKVAMRLTTPEAYNLTIDAALGAVERVLAGKTQSGAASPSQAFGAEFVLELAGVTLERI